jgi:hypothetical protein
MIMGKDWKATSSLLRPEGKYIAQRLLNGDTTAKTLDICSDYNSSIKQDNTIPIIEKATI